MATGRSDFPNQVNNVLGFPYIFRGALDVRARGINDEMKMAAVRALAALAKESVHDSVHAAYGEHDFSFGPEYLIPKPFDSRVLYYVAPAVAKAAIDSGMAREKINIADYTLRLKGKQNHGRVVLREYYDIARKAKKKRIAFPEGTNEKVLKAAAMAAEERIVEPVLLGKASIIQEQAKRLEIDISRFEVIEPPLDSRFASYVEAHYQAQSRKGMTKNEAERSVRLENIFANLMLAHGDVEGVVCGVDRSFPEMMRPILQTVGLRDGVNAASALFLVSINEQLYFFSDTAINITMTSEKLAEVAVMSAEFAESMGVTPRVAMLSYSNFGSNTHESAQMVRDARDMVIAKKPGLQIDGEMQADTAVMHSILKENYPFCQLDGPANVLVFPDMQSANISFKLLQRLGGARVVGPIILGLKAPAYVLQRHATSDEIFNIITVAVAQAEIHRREAKANKGKAQAKPALRVVNSENR
jgi:malate dehydrogenase (oxaloacetate-decarboxylating)(NADP+)